MNHNMAIDDEDVVSPEEDLSSSYEDSVSSVIVDESRSEEDGRSRRRAQKTGAGSLSRTPSQASQHQLKPQKRKATLQEARKAKAARLQGLYSNEYRKLLNADIEDATVQMLADERNPLFQSQNGMTIWTSHEKQMFFTALGRLGNDNSNGIAKRIGTKSVLEVQEYIQLLSQGMHEHTIKDARYGLVGLSEFPAAMHISQDCEVELEIAADVLAFRQERYEQGVEKKKWVAVPWLLDSNSHLMLEEQLADDHTRQSLLDDLPSLGLLNLGNFLELSSRVFMNPAPPFEDGNWQYIAEAHQEKPSIRATAFEDFHRLVISLTKRLVSATLFCAMSRLRATDSNSFHVRPIVKPVDVEAAAKTIGIALSSDKFWAGCPRRCHLNVYMRKSNLAPMDYDVLDSILSKKDAIEPPQDMQTERSASSESSRGSPQSDISESEPEGSLQGSNSESDVASNPTRNLASEYLSLIAPSYAYHASAIDPSDSEFSTPVKYIDRETKRLQVKETAETAQHEYAELLDMRASLTEEKRLWTSILRKEPPFAIDVEDVPLPEEAPVLERKDEEELEGWRDRVEYWSHWEVLERPEKVAAFDEAVETPAQEKLMEEGGDRGNIDMEGESENEIPSHRQG